MDVIKKNFGDCLKILRKIKGFTQEQLAERVGINLRQLARIEAGESFITSETLHKICEVLSIAPWELFNFDIQTETLMTGTGNVVHLNVIKEGNVHYMVSKQTCETITNTESKNKEGAFDQRMLNIAKSLSKEIIVDEIREGKPFCTKKYYPNGEIIIENKKEDNGFETLKTKINKIINDKEKIAFINLAFDAISSKESLEELKIFIKGIELSQNNN